MLSSEMEHNSVNTTIVFISDRVHTGNELTTHIRCDLKNHVPQPQSLKLEDAVSYAAFGVRPVSSCGQLNAHLSIELKDDSCRTSFISHLDTPLSFAI